jgi:NAD(P) transhydrogenase subunit beta
VLIETILIMKTTTLQLTIATVASGLIGAVTFWGSLVAFAKLQGIVTEKPVRYRGEQIVKSLLFGGSLFLGVLIVLQPERTFLYWYLVASASVLGVMLTMPIGGADMPVVIALLNSYSGLAAAATGFVLSNSVLIIAGSLVGASGIILTRIMCRRRLPCFSKQPGESFSYRVTAWPLHRPSMWSESFFRHWRPTE